MAALESATKKTAKPKVSVRQVLADAIRDLTDTLKRDPDEARALLGRLVKSITLKPDGQRVVAEVAHGNVMGLFAVTGSVDDVILGVGDDGYQFQPRKVGNVVPEERIPSFPPVVCAVA